MQNQLSIPGQARPLSGPPLRYRAIASSYESSVLDVGWDDIVYALDWCTEDPRVFHTLSVSREVARGIGLDLRDLTDFDAFVAALHAAGRPVRHHRVRDYPTSTGSVAVALGLPPGASLQVESQVLYDEEKRPLALEMTYGLWLGR